MTISDEEAADFVELAADFAVTRARELLYDGVEQARVAAWVQQDLAVRRTGAEAVRRAWVLLGLAAMTADEALLWCVVCEGRGVMPAVAPVLGPAGDEAEVVLPASMADVCLMCEGTGAEESVRGPHPGVRFAHGVYAVRDAEDRIISYPEFVTNACWSAALGGVRASDTDTSEGRLPWAA
jgi:hypothetical protein